MNPKSTSEWKQNSQCIAKDLHSVNQWGLGSSPDPFIFSVLGISSPSYVFSDLCLTHLPDKWMDQPELRDWVFQNRLFHMAGANPAIVSDRLNYIFKVLPKNGIGN